MKYLYTSTPISVAGITLIPIGRVQIDSEKRAYAYWLNAIKEAVAVVICDKEPPRALSIESKEIAVDELITSVPDLEAQLKAFCFSTSHRTDTS